MGDNNKRARVEEEQALKKYATCNNADEDILNQDNDTGTPLNPRYPDIRAMYYEHKSFHWDVGEVRSKMTADKWDKLEPDEQTFISFLLIFFLTVDSIVMNNVAGNFQNDVAIPAAKQFYAWQGGTESIHADTYELWVEAYLDAKAIPVLMERIKNLESMKRKNAFCKKYMDPRLPFAVRLLAFSCVEGIFFCSSFAGMFWVRMKGYLPGLSLGNGLIFRDESKHVDFADLLFSKIKNRPTEDEIVEIVMEAVDIECAYTRDALPAKGLLGMNYDLMVQYIQFVANLRLIGLGCKPIYHIEDDYTVRNIHNGGRDQQPISIEPIKNMYEKGENFYFKPVPQPFGFMNLTSVVPDSNFFEKTDGQYVKGTSVDTSINHDAALDYD